MTSLESNTPSSNSTYLSVLFHERTITDLKFHPDGDVFFAASKDATVSMTNLEGRVLGSFEEHTGAISTISCSGNNLITAGLDMKLISWDIITGKPVYSIPTESVIRGLDYNNQIYLCTDNSMNRESFVGFLDPRGNEITRICALDDPATKIIQIADFLIISTVTGRIFKIDLKNNQIIQNIKIHQAKITDMKPSACKSFFITSSSDSTALIIDSDSFKVIKKFDNEEPVNSSCIFSSNDKVVSVGGINARDVTVTQSNKGSFDTNFFDIVTEQKIGTYSTHFGTINAVDVHPECTHFISGGEDGSIHLIKMGVDFVTAPFTLLD